MKYAEEIRKLEIAQKIEVLAKEAQKVAEEIGFSIGISTGVFDDGTAYTPSIQFHPRRGDCVIAEMSEEGEAYRGLLEALESKAAVS